MKSALLLAGLLAVAAPALASEPPGTVVLSHGIFDHVAVYPPQSRITGFALVLSDREGWDAASQNLARAMAEQGTLVAGIDTPAMLANIADSGDDCTFPDGDMENLARFVQAYEKVPGYYPPIMVGRGEGASMAYALHAQARPERFAGLITVDFHPRLQTPVPLCQGEGKYFASRAGGVVDLLPSGQAAHPWFALQAWTTPMEADTARFLASAQGVQVRHTDAIIPALIASVNTLNRQRPGLPAPMAASVSDLPVVEVPASGQAHGDTLAILLSGDGGWADLDKDVGDALAKDGIPVVGLDSLRYFWTARTPDSVTRDIDRLIRFYRDHWKRDRVLLIGYSQGADVLPFVVNRLPEDSLRHVSLTALMGLGRQAAFEFQLSNWLTAPSRGLPILPEAQRMPAGLAMCVYGEEEAGESSCPGLDTAKTRVLRLSGGHHFDGDYAGLARRIIAGAHR